MSLSNDDSVVDVESLRGIVAAIFAAVGVPEDDSEIGADVLVESDLRGVTSHGVSNMLPKYIDWIESGATNPRPEWRIVRDAPATANVDADRGLGIFLAPRMIDLAVDKARKNGIGVVTLHGGRHLGMCAYHAMRALDHSMIGICATATGPLVVPTNGTEVRLGTNPLAVAAPLGPGQPPFVFDGATSVIPGNKVLEAQATGADLPAGVVADESGQPITEPGPAPATIRLLPLGSTPATGSHKGYGLAMIVEILTGILAGAGFAANLGFSMANHLLMAIDISAFIDPDEFHEIMREYVATLRATPAVAGTSGVMIPGELEWAARARNVEAGVRLRRQTVDWLNQTATRLGIEPRIATDW